MKTRIILGIVVCALFLSTQAFALDPWDYIRTPCSEGDVFEHMGYPDREIGYRVGRQKRYSLHYKRVNHNGKTVFIVFTVVRGNIRNVVTDMTVNILNTNAPVW